MKRIKPVTDAECKKNIKMCDEAEIEIKEIQKAYHDKFIMMLPAKKVYDILNAEDRFHRQMFKRTANKNRKNKWRLDMHGRAMACRLCSSLFRACMQKAVFCSAKHGLLSYVLPCIAL